MTIFDSLAEIPARRWIAGRKLEDAINTVRELNSAGLSAIINHLGEDVTDKAYVKNAVKTSMDIIDAIRRNKLKADLAVKLTDLGLDIDFGFCSKNYKEVVKYAKRKGVFVWIDMEEAEFVGETIKIYSSAIKMGNVGICIQSYLKRSMEDLEKLDKRAVIRLVKGAYVDKVNGFRTRKETTGNYVLLMDYIFKNFKHFTIGTHDSSLIDIALSMNNKYKRDVTYAMLKGVRNDYAVEIAKKKQKVSIYVPFGEEIIGYTYRRLKELSNLKLIIKSIIGG
jgi:proline dehydrogenase